jgi:spermidine synthase
MARSKRRTGARVPATTDAPVRRQAADAPGAAAFGDRLAIVLAFVGSGCLLILEIVAGRLLAPTLGVSLYTWTSVIGVVLAGVSVGNFLGGRLADRRPTRSTVALIYVAASAASLAILGLVHYVDTLELPSGAPAILQVLWLNLLLFFVPSAILGAATPVLTRISLHAVEEGGRVVGRIQAAASAGSIAGTFLTGFFLISEFGTRRIVAGVALTLLVLAIAARPPWLGARVYELGSLGAVILVAGSVSHSPCLRESNYYCIKVVNVTFDVPQASGKTEALTGYRALFLDRLLHGVSYLADPNVLYYRYERAYAAAIARLHPSGSDVDSLFLGGGAYTFPRYMASKYDGNVVVAEIDPAVTKVARQKLGLDTSRIDVHDEDARKLLRSMPANERFDFVLGDTFNDFEVPYHLTTTQFNDLLARHLAPHGLYMLNVIDSVRFDFLRSEVRTLRKTFPYVGLIALPGSWPPQRENRATYVLVAGKQPPAKPLDTVSAAQLDDFVRNGHSVVLTDDHAPVDQLLAPTFRQALQGH